MNCLSAIFFCNKEASIEARPAGSKIQLQGNDGGCVALIHGTTYAQVLILNRKSMICQFG
jgi:hypothetical protein